MRHSNLIKRLRQRLSQDDLDALRVLFAEPEQTRPEGYDAVIARTRARVPALRSQVDRSRQRLARRRRQIAEAPPGRRLTIVKSCPPSMLEPLVRDLLERSYEARFDSSSTSLELARQAIECVERLERESYLSPETTADLAAETRIHLGNALRISSEMAGAERAFAEADSLLARGTGDRRLRADLMKMTASLRFAQGRSNEAARLYEAEIGLRRLLDEPGELGRALVDRGIVAAWSGALDEACSYLERGVKRVDSPRYAALALHALAERLARDGRGLDAWMVVCAAQFLAPLVEGDKFKLHLSWVRGITLRALGAHERALPELEAVRERFTECGETHRAALVSLDLAAVAAAQGDVAAVKRHAEAAYAAFRSEGLERRALAAFLILHRAAQAEELTEELAVRVSNFVVRRPTAAAVEGNGR